MALHHSVHNRRAVRFGLLALSLALTATSLFEIMNDSHDSSDWSTGVSIASVSWLALFFILCKFYYGSMYTFAGAYVAVLALFHLGITIPDAFGISRSLTWDGGAMTRWLELAGWYTNLALGCLGVGIAGGMQPGASRRLNELELSRTLAACHSAGVGLFCASLIFLGIAFASLGNLLKYSRHEFFANVGDTRGLGLFLMTFPSAISLLVIGARGAAQRRVAGLIACVAFTIVMLSGYRTSALFPLMVGAIAWVKTGKSISTPIAAATIGGLVMLIPIVGLLRMMGPYAEMSERRIDVAIQDSEWADTFTTTGQTGGLLAHILRLVPATDPFRHGSSFVYALSSTIPNVLPEARDSARLIARSNGMREDAVRSLPPSDWLTYRTARWAFDSGQGVGFSAIGEAYLNFGILGVLFFFAFLGYGLARLDGSNLQRHSSLLIFATAMLWHLMRTVRDDFTNFTKPVAYIMIILLLWRIARAALPVGPTQTS